MLLSARTFYFASGRGAKYYNHRVCVYVCLFARLFVRLSACISQKPHNHISRNFLYMLPVTVARSPSDVNAIRYVLPVFWMTSCFHIMEGISQSQKTTCMFRRVRQVADPEAKSAIFDCILLWLDLIGSLVVKGILFLRFGVRVYGRSVDYRSSVDETCENTTSNGLNHDLSRPVNDHFQPPASPSTCRLALWLLL